MLPRRRAYLRQPVISKRPEPRYVREPREFTVLLKRERQIERPRYLPRGGQVTARRRDRRLIDRFRGIWGELAGGAIVRVRPLDRLEELRGHGAEQRPDDEGAGELMLVDSLYGPKRGRG